MALIKCPACGREISSDAASCPGCGHPIAPAPPRPEPRQSERKSTTGRTLGLGCLGLVAGLILLGMCSESDRGGASASDVMHGTLTRLATPCKTKEAVERMVELSNDKQAFALFVIDPRNGCSTTMGGESVIIDDVTFGYKKFHVVGDPQEWWVVSESIQ